MNVWTQRVEKHIPISISKQSSCQFLEKKFCVGFGTIWHWQLFDNHTFQTHSSLPPNLILLININQFRPICDIFMIRFFMCVNMYVWHFHSYVWHFYVWYFYVHAHDHARDHVMIMIIPIPCETFRKNILLDNIFVLSIFSYTLSGTIKNLNYQNVWVNNSWLGIFKSHLMDREVEAIQAANNKLLDCWRKYIT